MPPARLILAQEKSSRIGLKGRGLQHAEVQDGAVVEDWRWHGYEPREIPGLAWASADPSMCGEM